MESIIVNSSRNAWSICRKRKQINSNLSISEIRSGWSRYFKTNLLHKVRMALDSCSSIQIIGCRSTPVAQCHRQKMNGLNKENPNIWCFIFVQSSRWSFGIIKFSSIIIVSLATFVAIALGHVNSCPVFTTTQKRNYRILTYCVNTCF